MAVLFFRYGLIKMKTHTHIHTSTCTHMHTYNCVCVHAGSVCESWRSQTGMGVFLSEFLFIYEVGSLTEAEAH